jgi:hypothetical protein
VDLDLDAEPGVEVSLPGDAVVARTLLAHARTGTVGDRVVVRAPPSPGARLRLEAVVPSLQRAGPRERDAADAADAALRALSRFDEEAALAAFAPEYHSDFFDDVAEARRTLAFWKQAFERCDATTRPWSVDREGDRVVVRRVVTRWDLVPPGGGGAVHPILVPRMLVSYASEVDGAWRIATEDMLPLAPLSGRVTPKGEWRNEELGVVVSPAFASAVRPGPRGTADLDVFVGLGVPGLSGEVMGYRRADRTSGVPPIDREELERYGFEVVREGERTRGGTSGREAVIARTVGGVHRALQRRAVLGGESAVVVQVIASARTAAEARALLESHAVRVEEFLEAVTVGPAR